MKYDVFISYSRKDIDEVKRFIDRLQVAIPSLTCWFDITGVESGDEFEEKIIDAIDNSSNLIFFLSENSISSKWTKDEVMYAKNTDKKIVPILLKNAKLKGWFLFKFGRIDCIDSTADEQVNKLIENLSSWTGKKVLRGNDSTKLSHQQIAQPSNSTTAKSFEEKAKIVNEEAWAKWHAERQKAKNATVTQKHNTETTNTSTKIYKIGDYYNENGKEGVVFWIDATGKHGKIVSLDQVSLSWSTFVMACYVDAGAVNKTDGKANTDIAVSTLAYKLGQYEAFSYCRRKGEEWYLPAIEELELFLLNYTVHSAVNNTLRTIGKTVLSSKKDVAFYWSSTENNGEAWCIDIYNGCTRLESKCHDFYVRAVARF